MTAKPWYLPVPDRTFVKMVGEKDYEEKGKYTDTGTGKGVKQLKRIKKITQKSLNHNVLNTEHH